MTYKIAQKIITPENFQTNTNLIAEYGPIVQLGLQADPGTQFILNNSGTITMGAYGIYELDLKDGIGKIISEYFIA